MGLSIHYSGSFNPLTSLQEMIDEVADIVKFFKWSYEIYNCVFPELHADLVYDGKIYGISFAPF
ncbi:MAG: hypothetical protein ABIN89_10050 [Chitinophagaceae bacterium]